MSNSNTRVPSLNPFGPINIAFMGVHGSGKTTTAEALIKRIDAEVIHSGGVGGAALGPASISRMLAQKTFGVPRPQDLPPAQRSQFQWMGLALQIEALCVPELLNFRVFDRSPYDWVAYSEDYEHYSGALVHGKALSQDIANKAVSNCVNLLCYFPPPAWGLDDDGVRNNTESSFLDSRMRHLYHNTPYNVDCLHIQPGTVDERCEQIIARLRDRHPQLFRNRE